MSDSDYNIIVINNLGLAFIIFVSLSHSWWYMTNIDVLEVEEPI